MSSPSPADVRVVLTLLPRPRLLVLPRVGDAVAAALASPSLDTLDAVHRAVFCAASHDAGGLTRLGNALHAARAHSLTLFTARAEGMRERGAQLGGYVGEELRKEAVALEALVASLGSRST